MKLSKRGLLPRDYWRPCAALRSLCADVSWQTFSALPLTAPSSLRLHFLAIRHAAALIGVASSLACTHARAPISSEEPWPRGCFALILATVPELKSRFPDTLEIHGSYPDTMEQPVPPRLLGGIVGSLDWWLTGDTLFVLNSDDYNEFVLRGHRVGTGLEGQIVSKDSAAPGPWSFTGRAVTCPRSADAAS